MRPRVAVASAVAAFIGLPLGFGVSSLSPPSISRVTDACMIPRRPRGRRHLLFNAIALPDRDPCRMRDLRVRALNTEQLLPAVVMSVAALALRLLGGAARCAY